MGPRRLGLPSAKENLSKTGVHAGDARFVPVWHGDDNLEVHVGARVAALAPLRAIVELTSGAAAGVFVQVPARLLSLRGHLHLQRSVALARMGTNIRRPGMHGNLHGNRGDGSFLQGQGKGRLVQPIINATDLQ